MSPSKYGEDQQISLRLTTTRKSWPGRDLKYLRGSVIFQNTLMDLKRMTTSVLTTYRQTSLREEIILSFFCVQFLSVPTLGIIFFTEIVHLSRVLEGDGYMQICLPALWVELGLRYWLFGLCFCSSSWQDSARLTISRYLKGCQNEHFGRLQQLSHPEFSFY